MSLSPRTLPFFLTAWTAATAMASEPPTRRDQAAAEDTGPAAPSALPEETTPSTEATAPSSKTESSDCALGFAVWCFLRTSRAPSPPPTKWRVEAYAGYKISNIYYRHEIRGCQAAGCTLDFTGPSFAAGGFFNIAGRPDTDDYVDVGLSVSYMPIISTIVDNSTGFASEYGRVEPGDGALAYLPVRIALRRPNFLYLIKSKYLISEFGAGLAFPIASGAGQSFTGSDSIKATVGGRLGAQLPIADVFQVGLAGAWTVVWYGDLLDASFQTSYGVNLGYLL